MSDSRATGIIGLGYVGLPLALLFARAGGRVLGFDIDPAKVDALNAGRSYILHIGAARVAAARASGFEATTEFARIAECASVIICVPTPLKGRREPDISYILKTGETIAPHLRRGSLVVLESTTYPGTTDTDLRAVLEQGSHMKAGVDFHLAFSPEREDPGNPRSIVSEIPKVVGGLTPACLEKALALYGTAVERLVPVGSCRVAEAVKLTENVFRAVNIAMVNELKVVYDAMDLDIWEIIEAAKTKPFGFMPFYPGPGLGGHCIPIDPFYLAWKARQHGQETRFVELAGEVNTAMPQWVADRLIKALAARGGSVRGSRVLLLGIAYKANVDDDRESPGYVLWDLLEAAGATVGFHDPHVPVIRPSREHACYAGLRSEPLTAEVLAGYDAVLIVTKHEAVDYRVVANHARLIVDTRNALAGIPVKPENYVKA
jgi:UDP-N-acetyl-D-glucosamine dehydrogenase